MRAFLVETARSRRVLRQARSSWTVAAYYLLRAIGRVWFAASRVTQFVGFTLGIALLSVGALRLVTLSGCQPTPAVWPYCAVLLVLCIAYRLFREQIQAPRLLVASLQTTGLVGGVALAALGTDAFLPLFNLQSSF